MEPDFETLKKETAKYQELIVTGSMAETQRIKSELHQKFRGPRGSEYLIGLGRVLRAVKEGEQVEDIISRLKKTNLTLGERRAIADLETLLAEYKKRAR